METRTIKQTVTFKATPHEVYEALIDPMKHAEFTGGKASITRKVGSSYSVYDGYINGKNLELVPDERIVQTWQPDEDCWPKDHYSTVRFELAAVKNGTRLKFLQTGVPVACGKRFDTGWKEHYWAPMKEMLEK